jgi:phosphoglycolate phosphatase
MTDLETANMVPLQAVLFDLDGTLLDTPIAIAEQLVGAAADLFDVAADVDLARSLVGQPLETMCAQVLGAPVTDASTGQLAAAYLERYRERLVPAAAELVFPGVHSGLSQLRAHQIQLAVVTSKAHESAIAILNAAGLAHYFVAVIGADDVTRPKPHPDPGRLALTCLGAGADRSAMVGDSPVDIAMGNALGVKTIAVTYGVGSVGALVQVAPAALADSFEEVTQLALTGHQEVAQ